MIAGVFGPEPYWFDAVLAGCFTLGYVAYRFTGGDRDHAAEREEILRRVERDRKKTPPGGE